MKRIKYMIIGMVALMSLSASPAQSQEKYPVDRINLVVPYAPGATPDIVARKLAVALGKELGISIVVDNQAGASGQIGSRYVAASKPDGSTLLLTSTSHVTNPSIFRKLQYDTLSDFVPLALTGWTPSVLVINPSFPAKNIQEFIAAAKAHPGEYNFVSSGTGGLNHLAGEMLKMKVGIDMDYIPYNSSAEAISAVMGGHATAAFVAVSTAAPLVAEGRVRALITTGGQRAEALPDVPTMQEAAVPDFESVVWLGLFGPKGLSTEAKQLLLEKLKVILPSDDMAAFLASQSLKPPKHIYDAEFGDFVEAEIKKWAVVIDSAKLKKR